MKGLKRLAGVLGVIVLLFGMLTGCSGKKLYSEEELTQIHDVIGTVEQMTKEFQNVITDSLPTLDAHPDISKTTVERTLADLVKSEYIAKVGSGPATGYVKI